MKFLFFCLACTLPLFASDCNDVRPAHVYAKLQSDDSVDQWHPDCYWPMLAMESSEEGVYQIGSWLGGNTPPTPIYPPVAGDDITISLGWHTQENTVHYGIDYTHKDGETFPVYAVADGTVIWAGYHPGPGNVVIIEHKPLEGYTFRSIYHHLRDGRDHDIDLAQRTRAFIDTNPHYPWDHWARSYQALGDRAASELMSRGDMEWLKRNFGTPEQKLLVAEGQRVVAGEQIGWAGNCGIHSEGTHLHFMIARLAPWARKGIVAKGDARPDFRWTLFDPYGIYDKADNYPESLERHHPSLFAPAQQDFVNLDVEIFQRAVNYFSRFDYYPTTLNVSQDDKTLVNYVAGSFQPATQHPDLRLLTSLDEHRKEILDHQKQGWEPKKILATSRHHGEARYSTLFKIAEKRAWSAKDKLPAQNFGTEFGDFYTKKFHLVDFCPFYENNQLHFTAIWEKPAIWHHHSFSYDLTKEQLELRNEKFAEKKLSPKIIHKYRSPQGDILWAALWAYVQPDESVEYTLNLPTKEFYQHHKQMMRENFSLEHISVLDDSCAVVYRKKNKQTIPQAVTEAPKTLPLWDFLATNKLEGNESDLPVRGETMPLVEEEEPAPEVTPTTNIPGFLETDTTPLFIQEEAPEMPAMPPIQLDVAPQEAPQP